jgi:hypothetical protein
MEVKMRGIIAGIIVILFVFSGIMGCIAEIRTAPPPARVEVRPAVPFPDAVWIGGYWEYRHRNWVWAPGHWGKRPRPGAVWLPGYWKQTPKGWKRTPGHWR